MKTEFDFTLINDKELMNTFDELIPKIQNQIIMAGCRKGIKLIINQAKINFNGVKKNKSKTDYEDFTNGMLIRDSKKRVGVVAGLQGKEAYKYRFIDKGTAERRYITKKGIEHKIGKIEKKQWFTNAVKDKEKDAQELLQKAIIENTNKIVDKLNSKFNARHSA